MGAPKTIDDKFEIEYFTASDSGFVCTNIAMVDIVNQLRVNQLDALPCL